MDRAAIASMGRRSSIRIGIPVASSPSSGTQPTNSLASNSAATLNTDQVGNFKYVWLALVPVFPNRSGDIRPGSPGRPSRGNVIMPQQNVGPAGGFRRIKVMAVKGRPSTRLCQSERIGRAAAEQFGLPLGPQQDVRIVVARCAFSSHHHHPRHNRHRARPREAESVRCFAFRRNCRRRRHLTAGAT